MNRFIQRVMFLLLIILFMVGCGSATGTTTEDSAVPTTVAATTQVAPTEVPAAPTEEPQATVLPTELPAATEVAATATVAAPTETPMPTATTASLAMVGKPVRLMIPRIGIDAAIEAVGDDAQGRMDIPDRVENVAWYTKRAKPGESGNAVISGHLDDYKLDPAVFYDLNQLVAGDEVIVVDENGTEWHFSVENVAVYGDKEVPLDIVFGQAVIPKLNLITCKGTWDATAENYDQRLVVYTHLIQ